MPRQRWRTRGSGEKEASRGSWGLRSSKAGKRTAEQSLGVLWTVLPGLGTEELLKPLKGGAENLWLVPLPC